MQAITQSLPFLKQDYAAFADWRVFSSEHYRFHVLPGSIAERDIEVIMTRQEQAWRKIVDALKLNTPTEILKYYIYPDRETKERLMGDDGNAQAIWSDFSLHMVYNEKTKPLGEHEDTHLLTLPWGVSVGLLQEGLAEWLNGCTWNGVDSAEILRGKELPVLSDVLTHDGWADACDRYGENTMYPYAGCVARTFIQEFGVDSFRSLYQQTHREMNTQAIVDVLHTIAGDAWRHCDPRGND